MLPRLAWGSSGSRSGLLLLRLPWSASPSRGKGSADCEAHLLHLQHASNASEAWCPGGTVLQSTSETIMPPPISCVHAGGRSRPVLPRCVWCDDVQQLWWPLVCLCLCVVDVNVSSGLCHRVCAFLCHRSPNGEVREGRRRRRPDSSPTLTKHSLTSDSPSTLYRQKNRS